MPGPNSTPVWPAYIAEPKERQLAYQDAAGGWHLESGEIIEPGSWTEALDALFVHNLQVFVGNVEYLLARWPELTEAPEAEKAERGWWVDFGLNPQDLSIICVNVHRLWQAKRGRRWQTRKLVSAKPWGLPCDAALVQHARWLYETLQTGVEATPGGVGSATMHEQWRRHAGEKWPRHHRPSWSCILDLQDHMVGSRKEALHPLEVFTAAYELDRTNGFAAEVDCLPSGTAMPLPRDASKWLLPLEAPRVTVKHWWGLCYVRLYHDLAPGDIAPFGVRSDETGDWDWPTRAGGYWTWLWRQEAEAIQERYAQDGSMQVMGVDHAWAWPTETTQLSEWAEQLDQVRRVAEYDTSQPHDVRKQRATLVKTAIVAGIGRLGMRYSRLRVLRPDEPPAEGDRQVQSEYAPDMQLWVREEEEDLGTPKHWHAYIVAMQNLSLYRAWRAEYLAGKRVIAANVDGLYLAEQPVGGVRPEVAARGQYKVRYRGDYLSAPAPGIVITPDKVTTPGMTAVERRRIMRDGKRAGPLEGHERLRDDFRFSMRLANDKTLRELERLRQFYVQKIDTG